MGQAFHTNGQHRGRREFPRRQQVVCVSALPREVLMGASRSITCVVVSVFCAASAWAADGFEQKVAGTSSAMVIPAAGDALVENAAYQLSSEEGAPLQPWIHPRMNDGLRARVEMAFDIAAQRVQGAEACAELFTEFGVDATETLGSALYWPVLSFRDAKKLCGGRNLAFTFVGSPMTFICTDFERLSDQDAAVIIIHEALHTAGLKESPQYRGHGVKTSREINSMVAKSCHF
jgi:hypothetical protein